MYLFLNTDMKQRLHIITLAAAALLTGACDTTPKQQQFYSADSTLCATHNLRDDSWLIADKNGAEPVQQYDSMRVVERGEQGHPKTVVYYSGAWQHQFQYYSTMQLFSEQHLKDGRKEGRWASFYPNGNVWSESTYVDGRQEGPYRSMRENGAPIVIGQYSHGMPAGQWEFYDAMGNLAGTTMYGADGKPVQKEEFAE